MVVAGIVNEGAVPNLGEARAFATDSIKLLLDLAYPCRSASYSESPSLEESEFARQESPHPAATLRGADADGSTAKCPFTRESTGNQSTYTVSIVPVDRAFLRKGRNRTQSTPMDAGLRVNPQKRLVSNSMAFQCASKLAWACCAAAASRVVVKR
ncbi:hypothetical protein FB45DRAFT_919973 [Roridomyces roridus]|uniref:Uncharacterized protein n=1 Tax=Roridomyces roridus TaxID=1738132 RepID=A0AAD7BSI9_9AGAR|nr:hypothetical protein FB45DRAFT_919973 [Roridomyces roridus]